MRIVFDMQACQSPGSRTRGIGRYTFAHVHAFIKLATEHEVILILSNAFSEAIELVRQDFADVLDPANIRIFNGMTGLYDVSPNNRWRHDASLELYQDFVRALKPDVFHVCSLFEGYNDAITGIVDNHGGINCITLYDLIPYQYPKDYLPNVLVRDWYVRKLQCMKNADMLLAISESSRQESIDILSQPPDRVVNISSAIGDHFRVSPCSAERTLELQTKFGLRHEYILYTGGIDWRKNIEGLIAAYALLPHVLRDGLQLAVVCSIDLSSRERLQALAKASGLAAHELVLTGFVTEEELVDLYNMAKLFVFPSLHEGFGLPALEAMACGIPTLVSNTSSLPEVVNRVDMQFDPSDPRAISQAIIDTLDNPQRMADLREHGLQQAKMFSWEHTAEVTLQAFETALARKRAQTPFFAESAQLSSAERPPEGQPAPGPLPRLAFVSPVPPCESGIADYSAELLPELARYYEIDIITPQEEVTHPWVRGCFPKRSPEWFAQNAGSYDRVLYHFGNSAYHAHMFGLLETIPGTVVLHDFYLSGVLEYQQTWQGETGCYTQALYRSHGYAAVRTHHLDAPKSIKVYPANFPVLSQAQGVIVHSEYSRTLAEQFYGSAVGKDWACLPLLRVPKPLLDNAAAKQQLELPADSQVTATFGFIAPTKLTVELIQAWEQTQASNPNAYLALVGRNGEPHYDERVVALIEASPARERIRITGYVSAQDYDLWLAAADVTVQLRTGSRGETSAALYDCISAGKPLVYNANGSSAELPDSVAVRLPDAFEQQQLVDLLGNLLGSPVDLAQLGDAALAYRERIAPAKVALQYWQAIEGFTQDHPLARQRQLLTRLRKLASHDDQTLASHVELACAVTQNIGYGQLPSCYIDISQLRYPFAPAMAASLTTLLLDPPQGWRVELVESVDGAYQLACAKVCELLDIPNFGDLPLLSHVQDAWIHVKEVVAPPALFAKLSKKQLLDNVQLEHLTPKTLTQWLSGQSTAEVFR